MTFSLLSEAAEADLAVRIDVGVFAQHALDTGLGVADATVAELEALAAEGRRARDELLLANLRLLGYLSRREAARFGAPAEEVFQEGFFGLVRAVERYDPRRGRFGPWAAWWIKASIRGVSFDRRGSVRETKRHATIRRTAETLTQQRGAPAPAAAIAQVLDLPVATVARHLQSGREPDLDEAAVADDSPTREMSRVVARLDLRGAWERLPEPEAAVLAMRYGGLDGPVTLAKTAERLHLEIRTVRRLEARGLSRLRAGLGEDWRLAG